MSQKALPDHLNPALKVEPTAKLGEQTWLSETLYEGEDICYRLYVADGSRLTVLDRLTGFGGGQRDIESGFKNFEKEFWLASGQFDIRSFPELTVAEAIAKVKANANTCNPDRDNGEKK